MEETTWTLQRSFDVVHVLSFVVIIVTWELFFQTCTELKYIKNKLIEVTTP